VSDSLVTYTDLPGGLLEHPSNVLSGLLSPRVIDLDIHPLEAVCGGCHLVYWKPLGYCPECAG
jgi:hypothetical protein